MTEKCYGVYRRLPRTLESCEVYHRTTTFSVTQILVLVLGCTLYRDVRQSKVVVYYTVTLSIEAIPMG